MRLGLVELLILTVVIGIPLAFVIAFMIVRSTRRRSPRVRRTDTR